MNIKLCYLYRDGANYKNHHSVIFKNPGKVSLEEIRGAIRSKLIDDCWFVARKWNLPDLHFKQYAWDDEIDHQWHEFKCVAYTAEKETMDVGIEEFLNGLE